MRYTFHPVQGPCTTRHRRLAAGGGQAHDLSILPRVLNTDFPETVSGSGTGKKDKGNAGLPRLAPMGSVQGNGSGSASAVAHKGGQSRHRRTHSAPVFPETLISGAPGGLGTSQSMFELCRGNASHHEMSASANPLARATPVPLTLERLTQLRVRQISDCDSSGSHSRNGSNESLEAILNRGTPPPPVPDHSSSHCLNMKIADSHSGEEHLRPW